MGNFARNSPPRIVQGGCGATRPTTPPRHAHAQCTRPRVCRVVPGELPGKVRDESATARRGLDGRRQARDNPHARRCVREKRRVPGLDTLTATETSRHDSDVTGLGHGVLPGTRGVTRARRGCTRGPRGGSRGAKTATRPHWDTLVGGNFAKFAKFGQNRQKSPKIGEIRPPDRSRDPPPGVPRRARGGPGGPGGTNLCTFRRVFNNSPSRDKVFFFFSSDFGICPSLRL